LAKPTDNFVITDPTNDLGLMDIEKEQLEGRLSEFDRSLGNYREYNCSINSFDFYLGDMPRSIACQVYLIILLITPRHLIS